MAGVTPAIDNAVGQLEPPDDGDTGHDRCECIDGRGATAKQSGQDRHEQAHAHDGVEDTEGTHHASRRERHANAKRTGQHRRDASHAQHLHVGGLAIHEPLVEILRERRGEHEEYGVGGAQLGGEHRREPECPDREGHA